MQSLLELLNLIAEGWVGVALSQDDEELAGIRLYRDEICIRVSNTLKSSLKYFLSSGTVLGVAVSNTLKSSLKSSRERKKKKEGIKTLASKPKIKEKLVLLDYLGKKFGAYNKFLVIHVRNKEVLRLGRVKSILSLLGFKHVKIAPAAIRFFMP